MYTFLCTWLYPCIIELPNGTQESVIAQDSVQFHLRQGNKYFMLVNKNDLIITYVQISDEEFATYVSRYNLEKR